MNKGTESTTSSSTTQKAKSPLTPRRQSSRGTSHPLGRPDALDGDDIDNKNDSNDENDDVDSTLLNLSHDSKEDLVPLVRVTTGPHLSKKKGGGKLAALEIDKDNDHDSSSSSASSDHYNDHHGAGPPGSANTVQMVINIIISFVGAGLLGQPHAFMESGWMLGGMALLVISALNVYAMLLLPAVQQALMKRSPSGSASTSSSLATYSDIGRAILGPRGESIVIACLGISQAGFATAYIIFIAANIFSIAKIPRVWVCLGCIPGLMGLVQFRDLKSLSPFSLLANVANFCALSAVLFQDYESYEEEQQEAPRNNNNDAVDGNGNDEDDNIIHAFRWGGLLYVIAITIYSMEGVGLVLSLKASYQHPKRFAMVLSVTLAIISTFMVLFGVAGYWAFGNNTQAPITLNLTSAWSATFVKLALCLGLYLTYPIMMFPIWNIMEQPNYYPRLQSDARARAMVRGGIVVASATVAFVMPNFGTFLSLVGSSICTLLGFVFPCWFHLKVCGKELPWWQYGLDVVVLSGGCLFGALGTYQSIRAMLEGDEPME